MKFTAEFALVAFVAFASWILGSAFPAPAGLVALINPQALVERTRGELKNADWQALRAIAGDARAQSWAREAVNLAANAGRVITVERESDPETVAAEKPAPAANIAPPSSNNLAPLPIPSTTAAPSPSPAPPATAAPSPTAAPPPGAFEPTLAFCPEMTISNSPPGDGTGLVAHYSPRVNVQGVALAIEPVKTACLSSGFGERGGHLHKGIDFYNRGGGEIMAAADGTIIELKYRDDYGNMILIDHGHGVYTRYCHMSMFEKGLAVGSRVHAGDMLGLMGNTAGYAIPVHLHYELLVGDYNNPKGSFGLTPENIFGFLKAG